MPWHVAIGLGSNMSGDAASPEGQVCAAAAAVLEIPGTQLINASQMYATPPWGVVTQDEFRNAVLRVTTTTSPHDFLHACQNIESEAGRVRSQHWGPRTVDVDLLSFQDATGAQLLSSGRWDEDLILPHPYASVRGFVLVPWTEIGSEDLLTQVPADRGLAGEPEEKTVKDWAAALAEEDTRGIHAVGTVF